LIKNVRSDSVELDKLSGLEKSQETTV